MFYCNPCGDAHKWPKSVSRWRGCCEMCAEYSEDLNDIPSRALPDPTYREEATTSTTAKPK